jgi:hypothetical protein
MKLIQPYHLPPNPSEFLRECLREQAAPFNLGEWYVAYGRFDNDFISVEVEIGFQEYPELAYAEMINPDLLFNDYFEAVVKFASAWGNLFREFYTEPESHIYLGEN